MGFVPASQFGTDDRAKVLDYGNTGSGKSQLGSTAKNPAIALCERQALRTIRRRNPNAAIWLIESTDDLREMLIALTEQHARDECPYDTVVLDSLTEMQGILKKEILRKGGQSKETLSVGEWGVIIDKITDIVRAFRDLPMHVLVLCRAEESYVDDARHVRPSLNGKKLPNDIAGFFNVCGYSYKKMNDKGDIIHRVLFDGIEGYLTKADPELERVEYPYWPAWIRKMYGPDAPGAATDDEMTVEFLEAQSQRVEPSARAAAEAEAKQQAEGAGNTPSDGPSKDGPSKGKSKSKPKTETQANA